MKSKHSYAFCCKEDTRIEGGQVYEHGTFAEERERTDITDIISMIEQGATDREILEAYPSQYFRYRKSIEETRNDIMEQKFGSVRRLDLQVTYICGSTETGKTSHILNKYGDDKVFRMTGYGKNGNKEKFDGYRYEDVILFEEFRNSIAIEDMLNYLDIYPLRLPCRFKDKQACYTKVYIATNWPLYRQYQHEQKTDTDTWKAFLRRIHHVYDFDKSKDKPISKTDFRLIAVNQDDLPF